VVSKIGTVAPLLNNCCYGNAKLRPLFIVVDLHVNVNNTQPMTVVMEKRMCFFSTEIELKIFRTAVNNINVLGLHVMCVLCCPVLNKF
jgi:hypothetical protein